LLTKPIGVGILATALKRGLLKEGHYPALVQQMITLNKVGEDLGKLHDVHAMTDVTGFGLLGHLIEMAEGSDTSLELQYATIKKMDGLGDYLKQRTIPDATFRNWNSYSTRVDFKPGVDVMEAFNLLPDPQTNGGLLIAVHENSLEKVKEILISHGLSAFLEPIGRFMEKKEKTIVVK
jgi:selenide,water dikinase